MSRQIHIPNFKSISQKTGDKSLEKKCLQRAINQLKVGQTRQNLKLTCITSRCMTFQVNMSKGDKGKSGKRNFSKGQSLMYK